MRSLFLVLSLCAGCRGNTEVIVGAITDMRARGQIDQVRLTASRNGVPVTDPPPWDLVETPGGHYELPGSFGLYSGDGSGTSFELSVRAYKNNNMVANRELSLTLIEGQTLFVRASLTAACAPGVRPMCKPGETCVEGFCVPLEIDAKRLPRYRADLVTNLECTSAANYIVSSSGVPMNKLGDTCPEGSSCHEGVCWTGPADITVPTCIPDGGADGGCP